MGFIIANGEVFPEHTPITPGGKEVVVVLAGVYSCGTDEDCPFIVFAYAKTWSPTGWIEVGVREVNLPNPLCEGGTIMVPVGSTMLSPEQLNALNTARQQSWPRNETLKEGVSNLISKL